MKRFIPILLVLVALSCCLTLSARSYLGGSFSFAGNWNKDQGGNLVNSLSLSLHGSSTYYAETSNWFNSFSFGFSGKTDNVVDPLSTVSIGFLYRF